MLSSDEPIILLDMDGVLVNFNRGAIAAHKIPIDEDQITAWRWYDPYCTENEFYSRISAIPDFWINLEKHEWADELFRMCSLTAKVIFATSPMLCVGCPSQKVQWLRKHGYLAEWSTDYMLGPYKELMARPNTILIDDRHKNLVDFAVKGGHTIAFPQRWNKASHEIGDRLGYVKRELNRIVGQIVTG
jgi:5'(3')-deoxyribonucleotidase